MASELRNPFGVTKAVDLSDEQINDFWIDIPGSSFHSLLRPTSPMPMLVLGGKGSGKTHLMRYFSYPLQQLRHKDDVVRGIQHEGFLGIYLRSSGLNAQRFSGKGQDDETWRGVFAYYMELWLAQLLLGIVEEAFAATDEFSRKESEVVAGTLDLFDRQIVPSSRTLKGLNAFLRETQKSLDFKINNCAISRLLEPEILVSPGRLIFGAPQVLARTLPSLRNIQFLYLIDELENLTADQQRFINTLVREKESPTSFKIGARLYGVRTLGTYSADEENKEGSEFETLPLDQYMRSNSEYPTFAKRLCLRRLQRAGYLTPKGADEINTLETYFDAPPSTGLNPENTAEIVAKYAPERRPYLVKLRRQLEGVVATDAAPGLRSEHDIDKVLAHLSFPDNPLLEKTNVLIFYQRWSSNNDLLEAAKSIESGAKRFAQGRRQADYEQVYRHFKSDMVSQLLRECGFRQRYLGAETFIEMSQGCPRNLLIILKHIFDWATFNGEKPFVIGKISVDSQQAGVKEAAEWFFRDARMPGEDGVAIRNGVSRLATLFREIRFSDKPSECSVIAFSVDPSKLNPEAERVMRMAAQWSLLMEIGLGQRDRNSERIDEKYELNRMLSPYWDLPIARRGAVVLNRDMAAAIFDESKSGHFNELSKKVIDRMTAPWFGRRNKKATLFD